MQSSSAADRITTDGYVVLDGVVPGETVEALVDLVDRTIVDTDAQFGGNNFLGERTRRVFNLLGRDPDFASVPLHEPVLDVVEQILGPDLLLSSLTAIEMQPGETEQPLHADDASLPVPRPHDPLAVVAIWALTDFTRENGGTRLVPGSHRADRRPTRDDDAATIPTEMSAGSVIVYDGSLWHGGGANRSDSRRLGIVCNYSAGWLRQEENQLLAMTREHVAMFPPRLRRMIGYGTYRGLRGHVDGQDPATWFDPTMGEPMIWDRIT